MEVDLVVVLQTLSRGKLTLTKLTFLSLSSAKPLEIGLWTLVAESLDGEADKIKCVHLQSVIVFLLGVEVQVEVLDYYIVLLIPLGDLVK